MYEYEFRLRIILPDLTSMKTFLETFDKPVHNYTVKYIKHFRCQKEKLWEYKKKLRQTMVYHVKSANWIQFVESKEIPFNQWKQKYYKEFTQLIAFQQNIFDIEYRYEIQFQPNVKLYGYNKKYTEFGVVFEFEVGNDTIRHEKLPIDLSQLDLYSDLLALFYKQKPPPYTLQKCVRKSVLNTKKAIKNALQAIKHDGIFGHVYSYKNYIWEEWEDGQRYLFPDQTLGDGIVFGAERLEEKVILLYVAQVRGIGVYNILDILLKYFLTIPANAPLRYNIQYYYEKEVPLQNNKNSDGIIYHTETDKIYKVKLKHTIDLLYENGFFVTKEGLIQCPETNLINGTVYECDLDCKVLRPRYDRFVSNTPNQLKQILKCCNKKLHYSFLFDKE